MVEIRQTEVYARWFSSVRDRQARARIDMAKTQTRAWDVVEHLETDADMAAYLEAALEDGDPKLVAAALGDIARARGMAQIAREAGLGRESLYKALSPDGNPEFSTVLRVVRALGLRLHATTASEPVKS